MSEVYAERAAELLSYARLVAHEEDLARDAVQEAFMRYFIALSSGESIEAPRAWLYRVLHNYLLDRRREFRVRHERSLTDIRKHSGGSPDIESQCLRRELMAVAKSALTRREFDCFHLRSQGLPYDEIAAALRLQSGTVGALISRSVRKVRSLVLRTREGAA